MTDEYKLVPNSQIVKAAEPILKQHKAELREAVSLGDGQRTVWKWSLPNTKFEVSKGDEMNAEVIIKNSYDGSLQVHILSGAFRLVCSNGMIIGNVVEKHNYKHNIGNLNLDKLEEVIVNVIEKTMVQGYETWEKAVYETPVGQYRVYIGLKMGVGDANRLAKYIAENANNDVDIDELAENAIEEVL